VSESLIDMLIRHEGLRLKPYRCPAGKLTIGVGRNLDDVGISKEEAMRMLIHDIERVQGEMDRYLPWWTTLDVHRQVVLTNMAFNLGIHGLMKFEKFLLAVQQGDYERAAGEMLDSLWAKQVHRRAVELAALMQSPVET
jgi:lysozyme